MESFHLRLARCMHQAMTGRGAWLHQVMLLDLLPREASSAKAIGSRQEIGANLDHLGDDGQRWIESCYSMSSDMPWNSSHPATSSHRVRKIVGLERASFSKFSQSFDSMMRRMISIDLITMELVMLLLSLMYFSCFVVGCLEPSILWRVGYLLPNHKSEPQSGKRDVPMRDIQNCDVQQIKRPLPRSVGYTPIHRAQLTCFESSKSERGEWKVIEVHGRHKEMIRPKYSCGQGHNCCLAACQ